MYLWFSTDCRTREFCCVQTWRRVGSTFPRWTGSFSTTLLIKLLNTSIGSDEQPGDKAAREGERTSHTWSTSFSFSAGWFHVPCSQLQSGRSSARKAKGYRAHYTVDDVEHMMFIYIIVFAPPAARTAPVITWASRVLKCHVLSCRVASVLPSVPRFPGPSCSFSRKRWASCGTLGRRR